MTTDSPPTNQREASERALAMKQASDAYPVDERGYTSTPGAASYIGMSVPWLNKSRHYGGGPAFVKFGKSVRYSYAALDAWASKQSRTCTRELDPAEAEG